MVLGSEAGLETRRGNNVVNNYDLGKKLLTETGEIIEDLNRDYGSGAWNLTIRRAQEVVELTLKALLKMLGVEFPKVHDVGDVFVRVCEEKGIRIKDEILRRITQISASLAEDRAPSFYMERDYDADEAKEAKESTGWIHSMAEDLVKKLS